VITEIKNIEDSVRVRLNNKRKEAGIPFLEILRNYAMERFLYRLSLAEFSGEFILKGALLFTAWKIPERRTTLDIDLLAHHSNQITEIERVVREVCTVKAIPDGLRFDAASVVGTKIKEDADYEGVRVRFLGFLGKSRIPMQVDFGFGDATFPAPRKIHYPVILDFPAPKLKGYAPDTVVSEKFEAMVQLGSLNSRMKDFYDLWLILKRFDFNGETLSKALKKTFAHRKMPLPESKPLFVEDIYDDASDRQTLWKAFLKKGRIKHAPEKLGEAARGIEKFLTEPLEAIKNGQNFKGEWKAPGPWK